MTSIVSAPHSPSGDEQVLVTTNDSRLRLFSLLQKTCEVKYRGHENDSSQIRAGFSPDGQFIVVGSEDRNVCVAIQ